MPLFVAVGKTKEWSLMIHIFETAEPQKMLSCDNHIGESTGLPPMWCGPGSTSWHAVMYGLSLLVCYKILRGVSLGTQAFSSPKTNI